MPQVSIDIYNEQEQIVGEIEVSDQGDFPLALSMSVSDLRDITKRSGTYSKTFSVPASKSNNRVLNYLYNANIDHSETLRGQTSVIKVNGIPLFRGLLRVKRSMQSINPKQYEMEFVGDNLEWVDYFKEHSIRDLQYDHPSLGTYTLLDGSVDDSYMPQGTGQTKLCAKAIEASWNGSYNSGWDFVYSLKHYGQWKDPDRIVQVDEMRPDVYVLSILEKAFKATGYAIDSDFLMTNEFKQLVLPFVGKGFTLTESNTEPFGWKVGTSSEMTIAPGVGTLHFDNELNDPSSLITVKTISNGFGGSAIGTSFKVAASGKYKIQFIGSVKFSQPTSPIKTSFKVYCLDASTIDVINASNFLDADLFWESPTTAFQTYNTINTSFEKELEAGVEYAFYNVFSSRLVSIMPGALLTCKLSDEYLEQPFLPNTIFKLNEELPDVKLIDLLSDLVNLFDLYISTDTQSKKVTIEPRDAFYKGREETIDWSEKLDVSKDINIQFLNSYKRSLQFAYKDDSKDSLAKSYKADHGALPASLAYELSDRYPSGTQKMGPKNMAFTIMGAANDLATANCAAPYIPFFWNGDGSPPEPKYDFATRILKYEGFVTQTYQSKTAKWLWRNSNTVLNKIPSATSGSDALKLEWHGDNGLVNRYYLNDLKNLEEGKIVVAYFYLKTSDMLNLNMRVPIYLDQQHLRGYYYINKLVDYKPHEVGTTKVELIRAYPPDLNSIDLNNGVEATSSKTTVGIGAGSGKTSGSEALLNGTPSTVLQNGSNNWALANAGSTAIGAGLEAHGVNQHLQGSYNTISTTDLYQVGVGTSDTDRYRGLTFTNDGNFLVQGGYMYTSTGQEVLFASQRTTAGQPARFDKLHLKGNN